MEQRQGNPWVALQMAAVYETLGAQTAACREVEAFLEHPCSREHPQLRVQLLRPLLLKYQALDDWEGTEHAARRLLNESQEKQDVVLAREALAKVFRQRGNWSALEEQARALLSLAEQLSDRKTQILAHTDLVTVMDRKGHVEEAMNHTRKLIELTEDTGVKALWTMVLGGYHERVGALAEARKIYDELLEAPWLPSPHALRSLAQIALAFDLAQMGEVSAALVLVDQAEVENLAPAFQASARVTKCSVYRLGGRLHTVGKEVHTLWSLARQHSQEAVVQLLARLEQARLHLDRGESGLALRVAEEALDWAVRIDAMDSELDCTLLLADLCRIQGDLTRAERYLKDAEALAEQGGFRFKRVGLCNSWGCWAAQAGRYQEAKARFREALQLAQMMGTKAAQCGALILQAACVDLPCRDWMNMAECLDQALTLALTCEFRVYEAILTGLWGIWHLEAAGDLKKAYLYLSDSRQVMDETGFYGPLRALVEETLQSLEDRR